MNTQLFENELKQILSTYFGALEEENYQTLKSLLQWRSLHSGEVLFRQNDAAESMYMVISGRLIAKMKDEDQKYRSVGEISKGESVGETAILTEKPRSASVFALRDSVVVELKKETLFHYANQNPMLFLAFTKIIVKRLEKQNDKSVTQKQLNIALIPLSENINITSIKVQLENYLQQKQVCTSHDSQSINEYFHFDINNEQISIEQNALLSDYMYSLESDSHIVLYETDKTLTNWSKKCLLQADIIVFLSDFYENEAILSQNLDFVQTLRERVEDLPIYLTLLHNDSSKLPENTQKRWLDNIKPKQHFHIRLEKEKEVRRLARSISGQAIGLACGGGGAKGFAEIGVYKALLEEKIEIDYVAGVSFGALIAAAIAADWSVEKMQQECEAIFMKNNILRDYRIPFVSISGGQHVDREAQKGLPGNIEDMWLPFVCNSSNISNSSLFLHTKGNIFDGVRASLAIPGVLPPMIVEKNYLIDGGLINNLPVDILKNLGCTRTIGIDVGSANEIYAQEGQTMPTNWQIWKNKITGRKEKYPTFIQSIERAMMLTSFGHTKEMHELADFIFAPPVKKIGLTDWASVRNLIDLGYEYGKNVLEKLSETEKEKLR